MMRRMAVVVLPAFLALALSAPAAGFHLNPENPDSPLEDKLEQVNDGEGTMFDLPWTPFSEDEYDYAAEDLVAMQTDLGLTEDEALRRVRVENFAPLLEAQAAAQYPATFGGLWIDTDSTEPYVHIAFAREATRSSAAIRLMTPQFPHPELIVGQSVDHSLAELLAAQARMIADRGVARTAPPAFGLDGLMVGTDGRYDLGIDVVASRVVVTLDTLDTPALRQVFRDRYGADMVAFGEGSLVVLEADPCVYRDDCRYVMRGGIYISGCSTAFVSFDFETEERGVLSAAHCPGMARWHSGSEYGTVTKKHYGNDVDAEHIDKGNCCGNQWSSRPRVFVTADDQRSVKYSKGWAEITLGTRVLKSGHVTNTTRGFILDKWFTPEAMEDDATYRMVLTDYCAKGGDSGAAVMRSTTAWGIHGGGSPGECSDSDVSFFSSIEFVKVQLGVRLVAGP